MKRHGMKDMERIDYDKSEMAKQNLLTKNGRRSRMNIEFKNDYLILSTGRKIYANNLIFGIGQTSDGEIGVSQGYDGGVYTEEFTKDERKELANYVIDLWTKWIEGLN